MIGCPGEADGELGRAESGRTIADEQAQRPQRGVGVDAAGVGLGGELQPGVVVEERAGAGGRAQGRCQGGGSACRWPGRRITPPALTSPARLSLRPVTPNEDKSKLSGTEALKASGVKLAVNSAPGRAVSLTLTDGTRRSPVPGPWRRAAPGPGPPAGGRRRIGDHDRELVRVIEQIARRSVD